MGIKLSDEEIRLMLAHAEKEYPSECIGVITGNHDLPAKNEIKKLINKQDELHKTDPDSFKRSARTGYFVDPKEVFELNTQVEKEGKKILAFYHSHPDHEPYFSKEDHSAAVLWGEPVYPGTVYIIISVIKGSAKSALVFSWDGKNYMPNQKLLLKAGS